MIYKYALITKIYFKSKNCPDGWNADSPLTNIGLHQARLTGEALQLAGKKIDHVYCSPAFRCVQTCNSALEGEYIS